MSGSAMVLWLLMGCPYVFGGPDWSNVDDGPPTETGTTAVDTADTATTTAATGDTGPTTVETGDTASPLGPELLSLEAELRTLGAALSFEVDDPDQDLDGGFVTVTDGTITTDYTIPDDLAVWEPGGTSVAAWFVTDPCSGYDLDLEVTVTDAAGHTSAPLSAQAAASGLGTLPEIGDTPSLLGEIAPPVIVCGIIDTSLEEDRFRFLVPTSGDHKMTLTWEVSSDLGLTLYDQQGLFVAGADQIGLDKQPEILEQPLEAGVPWELRVEHWIDPPTPQWVVLIEGP